MAQLPLPKVKVLHDGILPGTGQRVLFGIGVIDSASNVQVDAFQPMHQIKFLAGFEG